MSEAIAPSTIETVRSSTCAVGYLTIPAEQFLKDVGSPVFQAIGTAFVVARWTVMTNRHVIVELLRVQNEKRIPDDQLFIQFVYSRGNEGVQVGFCKIQHFSYAESEAIDVALI